MPQSKAHRLESRGAALRQLIGGTPTSFLLEAHNGISARIAQEAGFAALWASGMTLSASLGLRDANEATWTQVLELLEYMADAVDIPILVDGDSGYGDFNSVRRLVRKLGERGLAGVCIEDKLFPKRNSFAAGEHPLADVKTFCGLIRAGKDSQPDDDFVFVARVEALIAGEAIDEAIRRAEAYHAAGADAVLIHSKQPTVAQIERFAALWGGRSPLIIVPTTYSATPLEMYRRIGVNAVIWANHMLRAAIVAMQEAAGRLAAGEIPAAMVHAFAPLDEVFRLSRHDELEMARARYQPNLGQQCGEDGTSGA